MCLQGVDPGINHENPPVPVFFSPASLEKIFTLPGEGRTIVPIRYPAADEE
ncbi:MAG: hypothetical protein M0Q91_13665 [Methanoregula sp.]|jgi:hypothetical protein|nr:hypothetical protein [Methanoregula sp.]